jgi:mannose-1-phosphate guanylyltransferase
MTRSPRIHGIVLAGAYNWGETRFERFLRGPLVPIAQRPLISYVLSWMGEAGVEDATICANGSSRAVRARLADEAALPLRLGYYEDPIPRGPAGCVRDAGLLSEADTLVVAEGTLVPSADVAELLEAHRSSRAALTIVVDQERRRRGLSAERPPSPSGLYVFDRRVLETIPATGFQDIKESLIPRLHRAGERVFTHAVAGVSPRVLNCETYLAVNEWMIDRVTDTPGSLSGYYLRWRNGGTPCGDVLAHVTAQIHPQARLLGAIVLGPGVRIMAGATIIGPTTIGEGCTVAPGAVVSRSVLWNRCVVGKEALVDRCLLADDAAIESSLTLFNSVKVHKPAAHDDTFERLAPALGQPEPQPVRSLLPGTILTGRAGSA